MGEKNNRLEEFLTKRENFADVFNGILFKGKQVLTARALTAVEGGCFLFQGKDKRGRRHRDIIKKADFGVTFVLLGIENQSKEDYAMPVRIMEYDVCSYREQLRELGELHKQKKDLKSGEEYLSGMKKQDKLMPVITLILYYGKNKWNAATDLADMVKLPMRWREELHSYFSNYKINLINLQDIKDADYFKSEFRKVVKILPFQQNKIKLKEFLRTNEEYRYLDGMTYGVIAELLHEEHLIARKSEEKGDTIDMCQAMQDWVAEGKAEGKAEAILEILKEYGAVSKSLQEKIMMQIDLEQLGDWLTTAIHVKTIEEFEQKM